MSKQIQEATETVASVKAALNGPKGTRRRLLRRVGLRALGVPFWEQDELLDQRRKTIVVSAHAMQKIGQRYHLGNPMVVIAEVADAIASCRVGREAPTEYRHRAKPGSMCAWTEDVSRIYIIRRLGAGRGWCVVTALPRVRDLKWWKKEKPLDVGGFAVIAEDAA